MASPLLYVGIYNRQLYVQESPQLLGRLNSVVSEPDTKALHFRYVPLKKILASCILNLHVVLVLRGVALLQLYVSPWKLILWPFTTEGLAVLP